MKKIGQINGKFSFFLIAAILVLCAGFLIVSCGKPQQKTKESNATQSAVDFSSSASGGPCPVVPCSGSAPASTSNPIPSIEGKEFTLEAWVKRKTASSLNAGIFSYMDSRGGMLYVKNNVPKFVIRRLPATGDAALASRTALTECVSIGVTTTECIVPAITQAGSTSNVAAILTTNTPTSTITTDSVNTINSSSPTAIFPATISVGGITITQIQLSSGSASAVTLPAGTYVASPTPGVDSTTFSATVNAVTDYPTTLAKDVWTHIAGVLTIEDQSSGPGNCATDPDGDGTVQGAEVPHMAIYINGVLTNCAETNGQYAGNSGSNKFEIATGDLSVDILPGIGSWSGTGNLEGVIDELRVWNYARPASKILQCMNTELGFGGACDRGDVGLIGYYRFNEGIDADFTDASGYGFSGSFEYIFNPDGLTDEEKFKGYETGWEAPGAPVSQED
ncbi:MAG: hypothetical protein HZC49_01625 [Nitrospirae bacterium]|nr:hypothetical protein [Nitrospirota bacterium]